MVRKLSRDKRHGLLVIVILEVVWHISGKECGEYYRLLPISKAGNAEIFRYKYVVGL
jgi:hypothetical protein